MSFASLKKLLAFCLLAFSLAACQGAGTNAPWEPESAANTGDYRLGPGDEVRVTVFGQEQLSGSFRVDGSGKIAMPLIGEVDAQGRSARELETAVAQKLSDGYLREARVSAEVVNFRPFYIFGEVNNPGQYPYVNGMTATTAVAMAGGYTYRGRQDYVVVIRGNDPQKQEYRAPVTTRVMPDDVIRVPERFF